MEKVFDIALIFSGHEWVESFHRHCTNTGDIKIRALVYDVAALNSDSFDACIISDSHPGLNQSFVDDMHQRQQKLIVISEDSHSSRSYLARIGVDAVFPNSLSARELAGEISEFLTTLDEVNIEIDRTSYQGIISLDSHDKESVIDVSHHHVTGILGTGGSGSTELALALARRTTDSLLIDLDFIHPSLAVRLQSDVTPNLLDSLEASQHNRDMFTESIHFSDVGNFIPGIAHSSFARDIKNHEITSLIKESRQNYSNCLLDLGAFSETSRRDVLTATALGECDSIVIAADPTPVGVLRLLELIAQIISIPLNHKEKINIAVAFNKHQGNRDIEKEIRKEMKDVECIDLIIFLPYVANFHYATWTDKSKYLKKFSHALDPLLLFLERTASIPSHDDAGFEEERVSA